MLKNLRQIEQSIDISRLEDQTLDDVSQVNAAAVSRNNSLMFFNDITPKHSNNVYESM